MPPPLLRLLRLRLRRRPPPWHAAAAATTGTGGCWVLSAAATATATATNAASAAAAAACFGVVGRSAFLQWWAPPLLQHRRGVHRGSSRAVTAEMTWRAAVVALARCRASNPAPVDMFAGGAGPSPRVVAVVLFAVLLLPAHSAPAGGGRGLTPTVAGRAGGGAGGPRALLPRRAAGQGPPPARYIMYYM